MKRDPFRWDMDRVRFHLNTPPAPSREIRKVGDILKDVVAGLEQPQCEDILVLRKAWPKLVGKQVADHSEPGFRKDNALHVWVDHPGWMPELERIKRILLQKLQAQYNELRIRRINFILQHK